MSIQFWLNHTLGDHPLDPSYATVIAASSLMVIILCGNTILFSQSITLSYRKLKVVKLGQLLRYSLCHFEYIEGG